MAPGIFKTAMDRIYATQIATDGAFTGVSGTMRVIDKSDGVDAPPGPRVANKVKAPTVRPAITIRDHEVASKGLTPAQLVGKWVEFNGGRWYVHAHEPRPRPDGASETFLYIRSQK